MEEQIESATNGGKKATLRTDTAARYDEHQYVRGKMNVFILRCLLVQCDLMPCSWKKRLDFFLSLYHRRTLKIWKMLDLRWLAMYIAQLPYDFSIFLTNINDEMKIETPCSWAKCVRIKSSNSEAQTEGNFLSKWSFLLAYLTGGNKIGLLINIVAS